MPAQSPEEAGQPSWVRLNSEYDPGQFLFDYVNDRQLADVAQSLGLDLAESRQITRDTRGGGSAKFSLKVVELANTHDDGLAESAAHAGAMHTATLIAILARLKQAAALSVLSQPSVDGPGGMVAACSAAAASHSWTVVDGDWVVGADGQRLTLVRSSAARADLDADDIRIEVEIPALPDEVLPTGRVRLVDMRRIAASVFGHVEAWDEADRRAAVIAQAVFLRIGDPRFTWSGASFGDNVNGDF